MKFSKVCLKNFQGHKDSVFDFDSNFTCIIGENDQGKSSFVRAIQFMYFDLWDDSFVRKGADFAEVTVVRDDGISITRRKGDGTNEIEFKKDGKVIEKYEKFGRKVSDEIKEKFQLTSVKLDVNKEENINIDSQFDRPFLLFESGPTKLKILNRITGAHIIDIAQRELKKDKKRLMSKSRELEELVIEEDEKLQRYKDLKLTEEKFKKAYKAYKKVNKLYDELDELSSIATKIQSWKEKYNRYKNTREQLKKVDFGLAKKIKKDLNNLNKLEEYKDQLINLKSSLADTDDKLDKLHQTYMSSFTDIKEVLLAEKVCPTCLHTLEQKDVDRIIKEKYE